MRILVTGTSGQLVQSLIERGANDPSIEIFAVGRPQIDFMEVNAARAAIESAKPDIVINAAAYTAVDQAEDDEDAAMRINAEAAGEVAAGAAAVGAAVVQVSTDYVFDGTKIDGYREDDPVSPLGVYGRSKLLGEERVRRANPRHAIVRTAWVYSPFGRNFVNSIVAAARTRDKLTVVDDQRGSPTSALDLADALIVLATAGRGWGETYHLAGTGSASWCEFAKEIMLDCAAFGLPEVPVVPISTEEWPTRATRPANSVLDSSKFQRMFGFALPQWRDSTRNVVERIARSAR